MIINFPYYKLRLLILLTLLSNFLLAQTNSKHVQVRGYTRSDGTYVQPYMRTAPNNTNSDNFSTIGNVNPYTGKPGYIPSDRGNVYPQYTPSVQSANTVNYNSSYKSNPSDYSGYSDRISSNYSRTDESNNYLSECYNENSRLNSKIDSLQLLLKQFEENRNLDNKIHEKIIDSIQQKVTIQINEAEKKAVDSMLIINSLNEPDNSSQHKMEPTSIFFLILIFILVAIIAFKK